MGVHRWFGVVLLLAFVPASSLLGLVRPMTDEPVDDGWQVFGDVWSANFWGDMTFVVGTVAAGTLVAMMVGFASRAGRPTRQRVLLLVACVAASVLLHWAVYAFSWSLTIHPYLDDTFGEQDGFESDHDTGFWSWDWDMMYSEPLLGLENAWTFTWCWGWAGLVFAGLAGPLGAWLLSRTPAPVPARATPA